MHASVLNKIQIQEIASPPVTALKHLVTHIIMSHHWTLAETGNKVTGKQSDTNGKPLLPEQA